MPRNGTSKDMKPESSSESNERTGARTWRRTEVASLTPLVLALALLGAASATAQDPDDLPEFDERAVVFEVQVPVNVVGRNGESVRGLTREDFQILDEGEVQEVTGFQVVDLDLLVPVSYTHLTLPTKRIV